MIPGGSFYQIYDEIISSALIRKFLKVLATGGRMKKIDTININKFKWDEFLWRDPKKEGETVGQCGNSN